MQTMFAKEYCDFIAQEGKKHKYNAKSVIIDGVRFDSTIEANDWQELKLRERSGEIRNLKRQISFTLQNAFTSRGKKYQPITMIVDFVWEERSVHHYSGWLKIAADRKGVKTQGYQIKKKLFVKLYGEQYEFRELIK